MKKPSKKLYSFWADENQLNTFQERNKNSSKRLRELISIDNAKKIKK